MSYVTLFVLLYPMLVQFDICARTKMTIQTITHYAFQTCSLWTVYIPLYGIAYMM